MPTLKIGITLPASGEREPGGVVALARQVERLGLESVWTPDVLTGTGDPALEATVALAAAAAVTERVGVGFCTLVPPVRPVALTAAQVQSLQHLSGNRLLLGIGSGGFPDSPFWQAAGVPGRERGTRTDAALAALPGLVAGEPVRLAPDQPELRLAPGAPPPPILVGGNSDVAIRRTVTSGDGWFPSLIGPAALAARIDKLHAVTAEHGRATPPSVTVGGHVVFGTGDAAATARAHLVEQIEAHGMPRQQAAEAPMPGGSAAELAERLAAYAAAGVERVVTGPEGEDWQRQCELIAEAAALVN